MCWTSARRKSRSCLSLGATLRGFLVGLRGSPTGVMDDGGGGGSRLKGICWSEMALRGFKGAVLGFAGIGGDGYRIL